MMFRGCAGCSSRFMVMPIRGFMIIPAASQPLLVQSCRLNHIIRTKNIWLLARKYGRHCSLTSMNHRREADKTFNSYLPRSFTEAHGNRKPKEFTHGYILLSYP